MLNFGAKALTAVGRSSTTGLNAPEKMLFLLVLYSDVVKCSKFQKVGLKVVKMKFRGQINIVIAPLLQYKCGLRNLI